MIKFITVCASLLTVSTGVVVSAATPANPSNPGDYDVAAYYWPAYHPEARWNPFFKENIGEWEIIRDCKPRFPGHQQPNVPLWGYENEADLRVMEKKIEAAASHAVNVLIFDWYWYANQPFLEECLDNGFLKARNNAKIKFFLMWANHDAGSLWNIEKSDRPNQIIWPGAVDRKTFDTVVDRVIARYMHHPSYYKIDGKPVFSIYELGTLVKGLGGIEQTRQALDSFRAKVRQAGFPGLHIQAILWAKVPASLSMVPGDRMPTQNNTIEQLGIDSLTNYQWCHLVTPKGDYSRWAEQCMAQWEPWVKTFAVPYYPHVTVGWDSNPRFKKIHDTVIVNRSPELFASYLRRARNYVDQHKLHPKLITINSWNEWSEGSYLEPDRRFGWKYLEAVRDVFSVKLGVESGP